MKSPDQKLNVNENVASEEKSHDVFNDIPPQYKGMSSEVVEEFWQNPIFFDEEQNVAAADRRKSALEIIKKNEYDREEQKRESLKQQYAVLSEEQKKEFLEAQKSVPEIISGYMQGAKEIDGLTAEESYVLGKIKSEYENFKKSNPEQPFVFELAKDIDRRVYENFAQKSAFEILHDRKKLKDHDQANGMREKIGIPKQDVLEDHEGVPSSDAVEQNKKVDTNSIMNIEDRKKLEGWQASFELAKIAKIQGIDLSKMSREEYMQFAIDNSLSIDDDQLRCAVWQRGEMSMEELIIARKKKKEELHGSPVDMDFSRFGNDIKRIAGENEREIKNGIRVRSGTHTSNSWLFFCVNEGAEFTPQETYKSYLSLSDLGKLTPDRFVSFMETLRDAGYQGDVKIFQDLAEQGVLLNDQIVMHGRTEKDAQLALTIAETFFNDDLSQKGVGKDEVIDGKNYSYSQILAKKIKEEVQSQ